MLTTELRSYFEDAALVALDIETTGLSPWKDVVTAISISDGAEAVVIDIRDMRLSDVGAWLDEYIFPKHVVGHNLQFDLPFLRVQTGCGYPAKVFDTQLAETLLTAGQWEEDEDEEGETRRHRAQRSLQATAQRRLGAAISKEHDIRTGFTLDAEWSPEMVRYAENDTLFLIPLMEAQRGALAAEGMTAVANVEMRALPVFCEMVVRGVLVDTAGLKPLIAAAQATADEHRIALETTLTKHVFWLRKRKNAATELKLSEHRRLAAEAEARFVAEWEVMSLEMEEALNEWRNLWEGGTIEGAAKPLTADDIAAWADMKPKSKQDPTPAGRGRYVRRMMQRWRVDNPRPAGFTVDVTAPINVNSPQQKAAALVDYIEAYNAEHGTDLAPPPDFKKFTLVDYSVDAPEQIVEEIIRPLQLFTKNFKLVSSFGDSLTMMLRHDGRLSGGWRQAGTNTGRPSCSRPNLLNLPNSSEYRSKFVAAPGHKFIVADFSQIELRILAELSGDPTMIAVFRENRDLHTQTAADIYDVALEAVTDKQRKTAKIVNFGIAYGMAADALRRNLAGWGIRSTREEAAHYLAMWRKKYPVAWAWIENTGLAGLRNGYSATALGRRRYFERVNRDTPRYVQGKIRREAANHPIQGGNADVTKLAMVLMQGALLPLGGSVLLTVYDEVVAEVPDEHAVAAKQLVTDSMTVAAETILARVPVRVDCVISPSWAEADAVG